MSTEYFPLALSPPAGRATTPEPDGKLQRLSAPRAGGTPASSTSGAVLGKVANEIVTLRPMGVVITSVTTGALMSSFLIVFFSAAALAEGPITDRRAIVSAFVL